MATHQAIGAVAQAVAQLLEQSWRPVAHHGLEPQFVVYQGSDFAAPMETGISIFVHKVAIDQLQHTLPAAPEGHRDRLPLAVSLLMTAWGKEASVGHDLLGWAMRVIADNPILTSASLNAAVSGAFANHETVELIPIDLSSDAIVRLWQVLPNSLQLSVCYLARTLHVESGLSVQRDAPHGGPQPRAAGNGA